MNGLIFLKRLEPAASYVLVITYSVASATDVVAGTCSTLDKFSTVNGILIHPETVKRNQLWWVKRFQLTKLLNLVYVF